MPKITNFFFKVPEILIILAVVGCGVYFFMKDTVSRDPIKIYKTTSLPEKAASPLELSTKNDMPSEKVQPSSIAPAPTETGHEYTIHEYENHQDTEIPVDKTEIETSFTEKTEAADTDAINEVEDVETWVANQIADLTDKLSEKYPELVNLGSMTLDEINSLYPTAEDKAELLRLSTQAQVEFMADFRSLFSEVSPETIDESFAIVREMFAENWGTDIADRVMAELRTQLGQ